MYVALRLSSPILKTKPMEFCAWGTPCIIMGSGDADDRIRRKQMILAPILLVGTYTIFYFFVIHLFPSGLSDTLLSFGAALFVMVLGLWIIEAGLA